MSLNGIPTKFEIDIGAEITIISTKAYRAKGSPTLHPSTKTLRGPSNDPLKVKDRFIAILVKGSLEVEQELFIIVELHKQLLGCPVIQAVELAIRVLGVQECKSNPVARYPNLLSAWGI